jgi:Tol biopolymer transport system component/tRNA A-37 threonylcarbamoyl transferase component Bud32
MDHDRRRRVEEVCDAALDHDGHERAAFVSAACAGDEALRQEVESLLAHARRAEGFLAAPIDEIAAHVLADGDTASFLGRQFGSYTILSRLGTGGMGEVYRARDTKLGRDVAIKFVADVFLSDAERLARFEREARVLATLNHPHIGAIYGVEEADGVRGLVLELVEGATLAERLAPGPLPILEALTVARQIADAIEAAHEKGVIHRDLKPPNIKITPDGAVKVLDFGLARMFTEEGSAKDLPLGPPITVEGTAGRTREGVIAGTAAYMSPEQARGKAVDKRTDIWAFGCVLYEMLTARAAFPGQTLAVTIAGILEREPDTSALPAQTPVSIRRLLKRCFEKDPKRRLRDIGDARLEIEEALEGIVSSGVVASEPVNRSRPPATSPGRAARRSVLLGWWTAAAAGLLLIAGTGAWQLQRSEYFWRNPLEGAPVTRLTDFEGAEHHAAISRDGKFVTFLSDREGKWDAWATQVGTGDFQNLTKGRVEELRNPATRTVGFHPDGASVLLWSRVTDSARGGLVNAGWAVPTMGGPLRPYLPGISELDWSPDGRRIVYHPPTEGDPLFVTAPDEKSGRQIYVGRKGFHNHFPVWSPDGAFIYFVHGLVHGLALDESDVWRIRPTGGEPERLTFHDSRVTFPALLGNRMLLYLATDEHGYGPWIYAMDVERRVAHRISTGVEEYLSLAASADGRRLAATRSRSTHGLWRVPIGDRVTAEAEATPISPIAPGQSPRVGHGYIIYRAPKAGADGLMKLVGGTSTELWSGADGRALGGAAISPDGQRVAFVVQRRRVTQLYVMNADGSGARRVAGELDVRGSPSWSPDGQWLAVAANRGGEPQVVKIPLTGGTPVALVKEYSIDPIWAPSGQFLVYSGADVGTTFSVKAVNADATPHQLPNLILTRGARRLAFVGGDAALVFLKGDVTYKDFWLVDLETRRERQLTNLGRRFAIGDFDVSADGREIIFDRARDESDIVVFDLHRR